MLIFDRDGLVVLLEQMLFKFWTLLLSKLFSSLLGEGSIVWQRIVAKLETSGVFFKRVFLIHSIELVTVTSQILCEQ